MFVSFFFVTDVLYNWINQFKISCTNVWRRNSFSKIVNLGTFDPGDLVTPVSLGFLCCLGWMSGQSWRKAGQGVIELMIWNGFGTFNPGDLDLWPRDSKIYRVPLLPRTDVWTKFEEGISRCPRVNWSETKRLQRDLTFDFGHCI